ncbi:MAG: type II secretion system protein [Phycisphaerales bacterium]|nr:type II secretion system protein [Phycisphaerales bacterium]
MTRTPVGTRAFTVTELLIVVAIIGFLLALVLVGFQKARLMARTASCLSNQRQISLAQTSYASDNGGAYASNRTSVDASFSYTLTPFGGGSYPILINKGNTAQDSYHAWTASYGANMLGTAELEGALTKGRLYPYVGSPSAYRSPLDPTSRLRSYSLSGFVGGTVPEDSQEWATKWDDWFFAQEVTPREWITTHVQHHLHPEMTIMSIVEDDNDGFNFNNQGWVIDPRPPLGSLPPVDAPNPGAWANSAGWEGWIDWPAFWEKTNVTYSHVDGSTESYSMQNKSVITAIQGPPGVGLGHRYAQPADSLAEGPWRRDWMHFRDRLLPGVIPAMVPRYQQ